MGDLSSWLFVIAVTVLLVVVLVIRARVARSSSAPWTQGDGPVGRADYINTVRAEEDEATQLAGVHPRKAPPRWGRSGRNRVGGAVARPSSHTTGRASPHPAVRQEFRISA